MCLSEVFRWSCDRCTMNIKLPVGTGRGVTPMQREPTSWRQRLPMGTALWRACQRLGRDLGRSVRGWGTPVYEHVLDRAKIRWAASRGLTAGAAPVVSHGWLQIAAQASQVSTQPRRLIEIAAKRTPEGDFRVGDLEALPWPRIPSTWSPASAPSSLPTTRSARLPRLGASHGEGR